MLRPTCAVCLLGFVLSAASGCGWMSPPNWRHPGPAPYQQQRAVEFDPYPQDDTGPNVVGGRPLQYQKPKAETVRTRRLVALAGSVSGQKRTTRSRTRAS